MAKADEVPPFDFLSLVLIYRVFSFDDTGVRGDFGRLRLALLGFVAFECGSALFSSDLSYDSMTDVTLIVDESSFLGSRMKSNVEGRFTFADDCVLSVDFLTGVYDLELVLEPFLSFDF